MIRQVPKSLDKARYEKDSWLMNDMQIAFFDDVESVELDSATQAILRRSELAAELGKPKFW